MLLLLSGSGNPENQSMKGTAVFNTKMGDLWENTGLGRTLEDVNTKMFI